MLLNRPVHIFNCQFGETSTEVITKVLDMIKAAVESVAKPGILRLQKDVDILGKKIARRFEAFAGESLSHEFVILVKCGAQCKVAVLRFDWPNPDLKDLLATGEVRFRLQEEHPARKIFDIRVIAIIEAARLADLVI